MVSLQPKLRFTRFPAVGSLPSAICADALAFFFGLCRLHLVLWSFRSRGDVGRAGAAEKASGESLRLPRASDDAVTLTNAACSGLVSGRCFGVSVLK